MFILISRHRRFRLSNHLRLAGILAGICAFCLILTLIYLSTLPNFLQVVECLSEVRVPRYRWQMIPLYGLTTALTISSLLKIRSTSGWKPLASYLTLILLAVSMALPILLPVPVIPAPDGPYSIGTRVYELTDPERRELYSGRDEARRFQIQVWYPAVPASSDAPAHWMNHAEIFTRSISEEILELPPFFLDHLALVKLPAYRDSPVAGSGAGYPVILFSHGWNGFNAQNTGQAIELASHGYIVVATQHTYGAVITAFDDGTIARNRRETIRAEPGSPKATATRHEVST